MSFSRPAELPFEIYPILLVPSVVLLLHSRSIHAVCVRAWYGQTANKRKKETDAKERIFSPLLISDENSEAGVQQKTRTRRRRNWRRCVGAYVDVDVSDVSECVFNVCNLNVNPTNKIRFCEWKEVATAPPSALRILCERYTNSASTSHNAHTHMHGPARPPISNE